MLAFPLLGATVLLIGGRRTDRWGHFLGAATPVLSFVSAVGVASRAPSRAARSLPPAVLVGAGGLPG
jgi:NADH-quinone oxidoreductase subunit L